MEKDKSKLSAARKKLQEYKLSKGVIPPGVGTTVQSVNETVPTGPSETNGQSSTIVQQEFHYPPPPRSNNFSSTSQQETLDNHQVEHQQELTYSGYPAAPMIPPIQQGGVDFDYSAAGLFNTPSAGDHNQDGLSSSSECPVMERNGNDVIHNQEEESSGVSTSSYFIPSPVESFPSSDTITPSAPPPLSLASELFKANNQARNTDAGQDFPVNFFQPIPVAQQYQPVSFNGNNLFQQPNASSQDFIYNHPQTPLFYNVTGNNSGASMTPPPLSPPPLQQPTQAPSQPSELLYADSGSLPMETEIEITKEEIPLESNSNTNEEINVQSNDDVETGHLTDQQCVEIATEATGLFYPQETSNPESTEEGSSSTHNVIRSSPNFREPSMRTPTPLSRKLSGTSQDEKDRQEFQYLQRMQSVQDALELQLEELRIDNKRLTERKSEMTSQLENCEKAIQDLRRERDHAREEAKKMLQPLHAKINALYEENQKILQNSSSVGMELRVKLQEQTKNFENMEHAVIVVTNQKLELAAVLDQEKERCKELEAIVAKQEEELAILRNANSKLEDRVKVDQQKDAILHQMEDQRRHFQVQTETLQQELAIMKEKLRKTASASPSNESSPSPTTVFSGTVTNQHQHDGHSCDSHGPGQDHHHTADTDDHAHHHHEHPQNTEKSDSSDSHQHCHDHEHGHDHSHIHDGHDHSHDGHDHSHSSGHDHHDHCHDHDHAHDHSHDDHNLPHIKHTLSPDQSKNPIEEMKKRLHHLEWENSTFRSDVEKLAADAKDKKQYEAKCNQLQEECDRLREECQRLEMLVVQLQGENDTIGDYIALYQSQRLALKESAKEKDVQLENLAREREMLVAKMGELTQLLRELKGSSTQHAEGESSDQPGHICLGHHNHTPTSEPGTEPSKEIEGKIMNLLTEISSSSLIENFHPCAVCSGRLMNV